jgi:hypothetical protein
MILLAVAVLLLLTGCPGFQQLSPYDKARHIIGYHPTAMVVADSIVARWAKRQTDEAKKKEVLDKYDKIKKTIDDGIAAALKSVDVAEEAGKPVDESKLQEEVQALVKTALDFALSLEDAIVKEEPASQPATAPTPTTPNT